MRLVGILLALAACGCRAPTQITFEVTTDVPCEKLRGTSVVVGPLDALTAERPPTTTSAACTSDGRIGSLVVVPSGDDGALVGVRIVTGVAVDPTRCGPQGEGCIVAKRALRFVPHEPLTVKVGMDSACESVPCSGTDTCVDGACRSAIIGDSTVCAGSGCGDSALSPGSGPPTVADGGADATVPEGGEPDGAIDATVDAAADAPVDGAPEADGGVASIGVSYYFGCALRADHSVACWGANDHGELGGGSKLADSSAPAPVTVPKLDHVARLAVGSAHACAVRDDGGVDCWGFSDYGATGTGTATGIDDVSPTRVAVGAPVDLIAAGDNHTCAASVDGMSIWCWGLYLSRYDGTDAPTPLPAVGQRVLQLRGAAGTTCGLFADGLVRCWGDNNFDALGQGTSLASDASSPSPLVVSGLPPATRLCAGGAHVCAIDTTGQLWCWGENDEAELATTPATPQTGTPTKLFDPHTVDCACGDDFTCALFDDAGTSCWGYDYDGELGIPPPPGSVQTTPIAVPGLGPATAIAAGGISGCALLTVGGAACWGNNARHQLGAGPQLPAVPLGAHPVAF
jgi:hypothetical protein